MKTLKLFFAIHFLMFYNCKLSENEAEIQKNVLQDVFWGIIDSTFIDRRLHTIKIEEGSPIVDKNGKFLSYDTTGEYSRNLRRQIKIKAIENDTAKIIISIDRQNFDLNEKKYFDLYKHFNLSLKSTLLYTNQSIAYPIDVKLFGKHKKYILKNRSEMPSGFKIYDSKYPYHFGANIHISNACLDNSKKFGFLDVGVNCGGLCGRGYLIYIKKVKEKWEIDKIKETWIA